MSFLKFFLLFFLISLSSQSLRGSKLSIPSKDSFTPIKSGIPTYIELNAETSELYFSFDNQFDSSDIAIYTKFSHQYTTGMYFYDSYEKIKTDKDGEYIDYIKELDLSEKINYIESSKKCTYYIIIKDSGKFSAKDYITIFNEKDNIELKELEPFVIQMFLNNNQYSFSFEGEEDDVIEVDVNIQDKSFSQTIFIYKNDKEVYQGIKNKGIIQLNEEKEKGSYKILISSTKHEIYKKVRSSVVLRKAKTKARLIEPEKEISFYYVNTNAFSFYINLDNYELNEENIVTFKMSHNAYKNKLIQYCYATNMNFEKFDDNKFISNMPCHDEDSESKFARLDSLDTIYHLYFSRTKQAETNKTSYLLLHCSVKIEDEDYFDPEPISIFLSNQSTLIDFNETKNLNEKITIKEYIPKIYKIQVPLYENQEDNKLSYVFYTNVKIQTIFENTMLKPKYSDEEIFQIYAISNKDLKNEKDKYYKIYYIKIFGAEQEINFRVEAAEAEIYFAHGKYRFSKTLTQQHLNCGSSFYFIGTYSLVVNDTSFFIEEIYGEYDAYYRNQIIDEKGDDSILTNGDEKYLIKSKVGNLVGTLDILELKCQNPGYFNLHILKNYFSKTLVLNQRQVALVNKGELFIYPNNIGDETNVFLEISTPLGKPIKIVTYNKEIKDKDRYYQIGYDADSKPPEYIKLNIVEDGTIISTRLIKENLYEIAEKESFRSNEENILFELKNDKNYKNVNITIDGVVKNEYMYTLFKGDTNYPMDMLLSGYETMHLPENKYNINIILSNPFLKSNSMIADKTDSPFYLAFYVEDPDGKQKTISVSYNGIDKYDEWENSVIKTLPVDVNNKKYSLKIADGVKKLSVLYQSCGNSLKEVNLYSYDDLIYCFENKNKVNLGKFNNHLIPEQLGPVFNNDKGNEYTGAQIALVLDEISEKEIDYLNNPDITVLYQDGKILIWRSLEGVKEYVIFIFNTKNEKAKYIQNICYLDTLIKDYEDNKENYLKKNETDPDYIGIYKTTEKNFTVKEEGIYYVTVMGYMENKYPLKYVFNDIKYDSSLPPVTDSDNDSDKKEEESPHTLAIILGITIPLVVIAIAVAIYFIWKKKKEKEENIDENLPDVGNEALVRETVNTVK